MSEFRFPYAAEDLDVVMKHVHRLFDVHHTYKTISRVTGIPSETLRALRRNSSITRKTRDAVLALEILPPWETPGFVLRPRDPVPALGTVRRIRALARMGYPVSWVARGSGCDPNRLRCMKSQDMIFFQTAEQVRKFYRVAITVIPIGRLSDQTRARAEMKGWPGPGSWKDIDRDEAPATEGLRGVLIDFIRDWPGLTTMELQRKVRTELGIQGTTAGRLIREALDLGEIERVRNHRSVRVYAREETLHA